MNTTKEQREELARMIKDVGAYRTIYSRDGYPVSDILPALLADAERCAELERVIEGYRERLAALEDEDVVTVAYLAGVHDGKKRTTE